MDKIGFNWEGETIYLDYFYFLNQVWPGEGKSEKFCQEGENYSFLKERGSDLT
jgi:hypothetical protein